MVHFLSRKLYYSFKTERPLKVHCGSVTSFESLQRVKQITSVNCQAVLQGNKRKLIDLTKFNYFCSNYNFL